MSHQQQQEWIENDPREICLNVDIDQFVYDATNDTLTWKAVIPLFRRSPRVVIIKGRTKSIEFKIFDVVHLHRKTYYTNDLYPYMIILPWEEQPW